MGKPSSKSKSSNKNNGGGYFSWNFIGTWVLLPYLLGILISDYVVPPHIMSQWLSQQPPLIMFLKAEALVQEKSTSSSSSKQSQREMTAASSTTTANNQNQNCWEQFLDELEGDAKASLVDMMAHPDATPQVVVHRNGEVDSCGISTNFFQELKTTLLDTQMEECPASLSEKYQMESLLTRVFHLSLKNCPSLETDRTEEEGFLGFCDMGESKTPLLYDHDQLVPIVSHGASYLPCHFHSREGVRVSSFPTLIERLAQVYHTSQQEQQQNCQDDPDNNNQEQQVCTASSQSNREVHLYAVPAGRVFMFAPAYVGEIFDLPHIRGADPDKPVYMQVLSTSPRVFDIFNYFTRDESAELVEKAKNEKSETHRIKRSSTGASGYTLNKRRTSESGFDTHGKVAQAVKRRCFSVLGFDQYIESFSDGLQILRYNQTKAYTAHLDWIDTDGKQEHDYDSAGKGGNRYATILLYMTDMGEDDGGETVFVNAKPLGDNPKSYQDALTELRASPHAELFKQDSWEEKLVARCRSQLSVRPNSARAVLFYSQHPNGQPDRASLHGGCPVISTEPKWAANLWVWNTPRAGFPGNPKNPNYQPDPALAPVDPNEKFPKKHVTFANEEENPEFDNAELYYEDEFWAKLGKDDPPQAVNSYKGQTWNIKVDGVVKKTFVVGNGRTQRYIV